MSIAEYAMSLKGDKYAEVVKNDTKMLKAGKFAEHVYGVFNIKVDAKSTKASQIAKDAKGSVASKGDIQPGDVLCVEDGKGTITSLGVCYDADTYVCFDEKTGKVEVKEYKDLKNFTTVHVPQ